METFLIFTQVIIFCVGAGLSTLISISDRLDPYIFCQKMEKMWYMKEEKNGKVFFLTIFGKFPLYAK